MNAGSHISYTPPPGSLAAAVDALRDFSYRAITFTGTAVANPAAFSTLAYNPVRGAPHTFPYSERRQEETVKSISAMPPGGKNSVHVGVAGFFNLDVIAARKSSAAVLCDINPNQEMFWKMVLQGIIGSETREQFVERFAPILMHEIEIPKSRHNGCHNGKPLYEKEALGEHLQKELERAESWLGSDENYRHVRDLAMHGHIGVKTVDFTDAEAVKQLVDMLKQHGLRVDTLYLSNVTHYLMPGLNYYHTDNGSDWSPEGTQERLAKNPLERYRESVGILCDDDTIVLEAMVRQRSRDGVRGPYKKRGPDGKPIIEEDLPISFQTRLHKGPEQPLRIIDWIGKWAATHKEQALYR